MHVKECMHLYMHTCTREHRHAWPLLWKLPSWLLFLAQDAPTLACLVGQLWPFSTIQQMPRRAWWRGLCLTPLPAQASLGPWPVPDGLDQSCA